MVLCALDSREARHRAQDLWPDVLIDGATGDTALGLHVARAGEGPCVRCFLPVLDQDGPSVLERLASITGLPISSLIHGDELLPDEEVDRLPPALIVTAGFDPLMDSAKAYAEKLRAAGGQVDYRCFEEWPPGFFYWADSSAGRESMARCIAAIRGAIRGQDRN